MATNIIVFTLVFGVIVTGSHIHSNQGAGKQAPYICDADGESSEECKYRPRSKNDIPAFGSHLKVRFFLHKDASDPKKAVEIFYKNITSIHSANPYPIANNTKWKILIPGFPINGKSPFPENVLEAYMERMSKTPHQRYNILVVDWGKGPCQDDTTFTNITHTGAVGAKLAELLVYLDHHKFLTLRKNTHVIGFSAGAHVAGETSRFIFRKYNKRNLLYRITALDPAGGNFWGNEYFSYGGLRPAPWERVPRIRRSFVAFLDVIHTSKEYGMFKNFGDIDFYPNGANIQPGCKVHYYSKVNDFKALCSHVYATELFAKSIINDKQFQGCTGCDYFDRFEENGCECEDTPVLGEFVDEDTIEGFPRASGRAMLMTGDLQLFGKRFLQTLEANGEHMSRPNKWYQLC